MRKVINNLRNQPEEVRRHVLHVTTTIFAILLLSLWVVSLGRGLANSSPKENMAEMKEALEPFSNLKASAIDGHYSISGEGNQE